MSEQGFVPLKLYTFSYSQPCRAVEIFLLVNNIPFESLQINLLRGEQKSTPFIEVNPLKKVPVLDDNGFILKESSAILKYLCEKNNVANNWYPKDLQKCAQVDEYLEWHHMGTRVKAFSFVRYKVLEPLVTGVLPDKRELRKHQVRMLDMLDCLEKKWLGMNNFLCGEEISIADLLAATELEQLVLASVDVKTHCPKLGRWISRVREATEPYYESVHADLYTLYGKAYQVLSVMNDIGSKL